MQVIDRGLSWVWRVCLLIGLIVGIIIPPMLLRLVNELDDKGGPIGWQIALVIAYFAIFILVIIAASAAYRHYTGEVQLKRLRHQDFAYVLGGYLAIILCEGIFQIINQLLYQQNQTQNNAAIKSLMSGSPVAMWMMAISAVFLTPIVEELVFRGVLTNLFFKQEWLKIGLSGLVFGSLHSSSTVPSFLIYVTMGLILALVYRLSGKIQDSIILHFLINAGAMSIMIIGLLN
ncbi:type II CAAX endopeptidase family protein [Lactiplantibacillus sp. WILCCON 0030]|uniref:Type II CAAX endopeptidase family protein n=1 Tax=Lactiplantibacillus brownii TaxID=3069269 RepID=A0ABU1A9K7_9LACO|nr:type II CAAX endopeptidase family protein [Lactiplantibacillus brownii]MDQ7937132.1 type II CAAX endopeptidase family protein [Lactiplantibacillus brownii]